RIDVKYERLPPVTGIDQAIAPGAPLLDQSFANNIANRMEFKRGDVARGFDEADVVIEREFRTPMVHQGYMEPHACVARHGDDARRGLPRERTHIRLESPDQAWGEARWDTRCRERIALVRSGRVSRIAGGRGRDVPARPLPHSEFLHRSLRCGGQQAEGRRLS